MSMKGMGALTWFMGSDEAETWHTDCKMTKVPGIERGKKEDIAERKRPCHL
jgi:hypothetical protein